MDNLPLFRHQVANIKHKWLARSFLQWTLQVIKLENNNVNYIKTGLVISLNHYHPISQHQQVDIALSSTKTQLTSINLCDFIETHKRPKSHYTKYTSYKIIHFTITPKTGRSYSPTLIHTYLIIVKNPNLQSISSN